MNTEFLLLAQYERADIPLEWVARDYLGITARTASKRAEMARLPFPAFQAGSRKSPWLVNVRDLAAWLEQSRAAAREDWNNIRVA